VTFCENLELLISMKLGPPFSRTATATRWFAAGRPAETGLPCTAPPTEFPACPVRAPWMHVAASMRRYGGVLWLTHDEGVLVLPGPAALTPGPGAAKSDRQNPRKRRQLGSGA